MAFRLLVSTFTFSLVAEVSGLNCFWRANNQVVAEGVDGWFACNNTQVSPGGAQLCCLQGSQCGEDSICRSNNGYYLGGCTDATYADPVCATQCSADGQTWIQWNNTSNMWQCCGSGGCDGEPPTRSFTAIQPVSWTPIVTAPQSSSTNALLSTSASTSATMTTSAIITTSSSSSTGTSTAGKSGGLSSGAAAGIGVAVGVVALAAIIGLAAYLFLFRRRRRTPRTAEGDTQRRAEEEMLQQPPSPPPHFGTEAYSDQPKVALQELGPTELRELDAQNTQAAELAASEPDGMRDMKRV